ncbi:hypothetical protein DAPPUDRAFT_261849 [Daphnia pulex]|uniref:Uncharacterized protein n=1 Tax=Daphnia pulex TaxID=6669 RepID=E9HLT0_DAPPU|nr:hypothetical protein DAPPUDRAFT_261849 [Daphnia pulex]|eukprot:EFX67306.1 hypothetical protein DAPPUDRAFT_261849 [Daphnia pulex]
MIAGAMNSRPARSPRPAAQRSRAVGEDLGTCLLLDHIFNMGPPSLLAWRTRNF